MSVYSYTTDSIEIFEDPILYGFLTEAPAETIDAGDISVSASITEVNGYIVNTETVYPFGSAKVFGNSNSSFVKSISIEKHSIKLSGTLTEGIRFTWIGSGTLFEIGGGQERIIAPWVGSSGPLRFSGLSINKKSNSYKEFVSIFSTADDFGFVSSAVSSYQDFGNISVIEFDSGIDSYGYITNLTTEYSFGPIGLVNGSGICRYVPLYSHNSKLSINISGESTSEFIPSYDSFGLFDVTGGERYSVTSNNISSAVIFTIGSKKETASFDYNTNSIVTYSEEDFEFITSVGSTENYDLISLSVDSGIDSYGYITNLTTEYPFGSVATIGGHGIEEYKPIFGQRGQGSIIISGESSPQFIPSYDSFGLFDISGIGKCSIALTNTFSITTLFTNGLSEESTTFNYTLNSIEIHTKEDFGSITSLESTEDYGSLSLQFHSIAESYGYITNLTTEYSFGSVGVLQGSSIVNYAPIFAHNAKLNISVFGESVSEFVPSYDSFGLFNVTGGERYSSTFSNASSIILFAIGSSEEIASFDYNTSSVNLYSSEDYEFITSSGTTEDYGSITIPFDSGIDSYGYITNLTAEYPFGPIGVLQGSSIGRYVPLFAHNSKLIINVSGQSATEFVPSYDSFGLFDITGGERYSRTITNISTTTLFTIGSKKETASFDYNTNSIVTYSEEDFEFITSVGSVEDYGLISLPVDSGIDSYGYITNLTTEYPFGSVATIRGHGIEEYKPIFGQIGQGSFNISGESSTQFLPLFISSGLFDITGGERYSRTITNISTTTLFTIGSKQESKTFNYTLNSIEIHTKEDFGSITSFGSAEDYGSLSLQLHSIAEHYGYITNLTTEYPFGSIATISGHADEMFDPAFMQVGQALINVSGESLSKFVPSYDSFGLFNVTGGERYATTLSNVSKVTLFTIGSKEERASFDYNTSSITIYSEEDYEFITSSGTTEDYGSITIPFDSGIDSYGYITSLTTEYPFGSVASISGSVDLLITNGFTAVSGSLFALNGVAESVRVNPQESTALFTFNGFAQDSNTVIYIGKGTAFGFGSISKTSTVSENITTLFRISGESTQSFTEGLYTGSGSLFALNGVAESVRVNPPESTALFLLNGSAAENITESYIGRGSAFGFNGLSETVTVSENITTLFRISGASKQSFTEGLYTGSGSLFALNGALESVGFNPQESTALFTFNGFSKEKSTESYVGRGSVFGFNGISEAISVSENITTLFRISGASKQSFSEGLYTGSGSLFAVNGSVESVGFNPQESIALFTFNGFATESITESYIGRGSAFGFIGATESVSVSENITTLFTISGSGNESFTEGLYTGSGSLFAVNSSVIPTATYSTESTALFLLNGSAAENITESYIGKGTVFGFNGLSEVISVSENITTLFRISGASTQSFTEGLYTGSGSLFAVNGSILLTITSSTESTALFAFNGFAEEKSTESYVGKGIAFGFNGSTESTTISENITTLFTISGSGNESFTEGLYTGSGSLFAVNSSVIPTATYSTESTIPFAFNGFAAENITESYIGKGNIFGFGGVSEAVTVLENITTLFKISGSGKESFTEGLYTGSGSIFAINGSVILTASYSSESTIPFAFNGFAAENITESYIGTGRIFGFIGSTESVSVSENITTLFTISGASIESFTEGLYTGSGSLFAVNGSVESVGFNPQESTALFAFNGFAAENITESYIGTGRIFGFIGSTESVSVSENITTLFRISGASTQSFTEGLYTGSGSLFAVNGVADSVRFNPPESTTLFSFNGFSAYSNTVIYVGEGRIFGFISSTESVSVSENITTLFRISGQSKQIFSKGITSVSGSLFALNGVAESVRVNPQESTALFAFNGFSAYSNTVIYKGFAGSIFTIGSKKETASFDYNTNSIATYSQEDFEFITSSGITEDYGLISLSLDSGIDSYGYITNLITEYPFGSVATIGGHAEEIFNIGFNAVGFAEIKLVGESSNQLVPSFAYDSFGLFEITGQEKSTISISIESSGTLFTIGSKKESAVFDYNASSIEIYTEEDYGFITSVGSTEDYGLISLPLDSGIDSYGYITNLTTEYPFGSIATIGGSADSIISKGSFNASGSLFAFNGVAESIRVNPPESTALFVFSGFSTEKNTEHYTGTGRIFGFIGSTESVSVSENITTLFRISGTSKQVFSKNIVTVSGSLFAVNGSAESIRVNPPESTALFAFNGFSIEKNTLTYVGFGSIFTIGSKKETASFDYNISSIEIYSEDDFEFITSISSSEDYGLISLPLDSGIDSYGYITNLTTEYPFGSIATIGGHADEMFDPNFAQIALAEIKLSGEALSKFIPSYDSFGLFEITGQERSAKSVSIQSSGTLFTIGSKKESAVFDYNTSSVETYSEEEYGFINSSGTTEDYGLISLPLDSGIDSYGYITNLTTEYPFGSIARFSGSAGLLITVEYASVSGSLFAFNGVAESIRVNPPESTALFSVSGKSLESFGRATHFAAGGLTYSGFMTGMKLTVANPVGGTTFISGFIEESFTEGLYTGSGSLFGYTGSSKSVGVNPPESTALFSVSGKSLESFGRASHFAAGGLTYSGFMTGMKLTVVNPVGGNVFVSGFIEESFTEGLYTGSGSLFTVNGSTESVGANPPESTALFSVSGKSLESFARASHFADGRLTYSGFASGIKFTANNPVGGTTFISGFIEESFTEGLYTGSGSLFGYTGAAESKTVDIPEFFGLFNISGSGKESFTEGNYNASGSAYIDGFASDIKFSKANLVSGFIYVSGAVSDNISYNNVGSGSLFGYTGAAESKTVDIPEFFGLFNISGSKFEAYAKAPYIGSGSVEFGGKLLSEKQTESYVGSGDATLSGISDNRFVPNWISSGSLFAYSNGSQIEKQTDVYNGFGSLFGINGAVESVAVNPQERIKLVNIFGSAIEKNTESYSGSGNTIISGEVDAIFKPNLIGSGSVFVYGESLFKLSYNNFGFGSLFAINGAVESVAVNPQERIKLVNIFGSAIEKNTESYIGIGNASFASSVKELFTPNNIGFGSLFSIGGASESYGIAERFTGLFEIGGSKFEAYAKAPYIGSGSVEFGGKLLSEKQTESYVGSGDATLSGISDNRFVPNWISSGSLFGYSGAAESKTVDIPPFFGLFNLSGSKFEAYTKAPYIGSGKITTSGASTEKNTENYVGYVNASFNGSASELFIPHIIGSGSAFVYGNAAEKQTVIYIGSGNLFEFSGVEESTTVNPEENVFLFRFSGTLIERNTESYVGFAEETLSGRGTYKFIPNWNSFGTINVAGLVEESYTESYIGYITQEISGSAKEVSKIASYKGYSEISISGYITEKQTDSYSASGTLFGISGSESSASFNPPETTSLFVFEGSSTSTRGKQYTGFGSIFEFNGSAESSSKSEETFGLFEINGSSTVIFSRKYSASGTLFAISGSSESITYDLQEFTGLYTVSGYALSSVTSNPPENTAQYIVSGEVRDIKLSYGNKGSGYLFGINGASVVSAPSYAPEKIDGIKIFGKAKESYARSSYIASGTEFINGLSENEYRFFEPSFTYVIII